MTSEETPSLDRQAFVRHLARLKLWAEAMRELLCANGIEPPPLPPSQDEVPESGAAVQITMLRVELRQAAALVQDAEQEIEQHEREILVLKDHLNETTNEVLSLRRRLSIEPSPEEAAREAARLKRERGERVDRRERKGGEPAILVALREVGQATVRDLAQHLGISEASVAAALSQHRAKIAKTRGDGRCMIYRLADADAPALVEPAAAPSPVAEAIAVFETSVASGNAELVADFLTKRGSAAAVPFIAQRLGMAELDVEAGIVVLQIAGRVERRDLGDITQWKAKPARIEAA